MRLHHDAETEAFKASFLDWVAGNLPPASARTEPILSTCHLPPWAAAWQRAMFDAGWLMPGWPPEYGGRNATPLQQLVYHEAVAQAEVPRGYNPQGLSIIAPSIIERGTDEQIERFALPCLRGELTFALGMTLMALADFRGEGLWVSETLKIFVILEADGTSTGASVTAVGKIGVHF